MRRWRIRVRATGTGGRGEHVFGVVIRHRTAEAYVFQTHLFEGEQRAQTAVKASFAASELVVLAAETFYGDTDAYVGKPFGQLYDTVFKIARGGYDYTVGMSVAFLYNLGEVFAYERLSAREIDEFEARERTQILGFDFFVLVGRILPYIAHLTPHGASVCKYDGSICGFAYGHMLWLVFAEMT